MSGELETAHDSYAQSFEKPRWLTGVVVLIFLGGISYFAFETAKLALKFSSGPLWLSAALWLTTGFLAWISLSVSFLLLRRKITTGRFLLSRAESAERFAEMRTRTGAGK